jgi:hypothetical protein
VIVKHQGLLLSSPTPKCIMSFTSLSLALQQVREFQDVMELVEHDDDDLLGSDQQRDTVMAAMTHPAVNTSVRQESHTIRHNARRPFVTNPNHDSKDEEEYDRRLFLNPLNGVGGGGMTDDSDESGAEDSVSSTRGGCPLGMMADVSLKRRKEDSEEEGVSAPSHPPVSAADMFSKPAGGELDRRGTEFEGEREKEGESGEFERRKRHLMVDPRDVSASYGSGIQSYSGTVVHRQNQLQLYHPYTELVRRGRSVDSGYGDHQQQIQQAQTVNYNQPQQMQQQSIFTEGLTSTIGTSRGVHLMVCAI